MTKTLRIKKSHKNISKKIYRGGWDWPFGKSAEVIKGKTLPDFIKKEEMRISAVDKKIVADTCDIKDKSEIRYKYIPAIFDSLKGKYGTEIFSSQVFTLFPYCSEEIKHGDAPIVGSVAKMVDKVNASEVDIDIVNGLSQKFNTRFIVDPNIRQTNTQYISSYDVDKYIEFLENYNYNGKNLFIVSHSGFMQKMLFKLSTIKKFQIDNLDLFQFGFVEVGPQKYKIKYILVRKWTNDYNVSYIVDLNDGKVITDTNFITFFLNDKNKMKDVKSWVFQIRHCKGCHNTETGMVSKVSRTFSEYSIGYLQYALCLNDTPSEMMEKGTYLFNILKEFSINKDASLFQNYTFGSSVILRAILTGIMQVYILKGIEQGIQQTTLASSTLKIEPGPVLESETFEEEISTPVSDEPNTETVEASATIGEEISTPVTNKVEPNTETVEASATPVSDATTIPVTNKDGFVQSMIRQFETKKPIDGGKSRKIKKRKGKISRKRTIR